MIRGCEVGDCSCLLVAVVLNSGDEALRVCHSHIAEGMRIVQLRALNAALAARRPPPPRYVCGQAWMTAPVVAGRVEGNRVEYHFTEPESAPTFNWELPATAR